MVNFPTSLDTLTNPTSTDKVGVLKHSTQHANINDIAEALEAKVGIDGSAVQTSHDYKLGEVTGSDKAVGKSATQTLTNKTIIDLTSTGTNSGTETLDNKTLNSPRVGTAILDSNGNEVIITPATASAVNEITVTNSATGNDVQVTVTGDDTDIGLKIKAKGTGKVKLGTAELQVPNTDGTAGQFMQTDGSGNLSFGSATGVISGAILQWATGTAPTGYLLCDGSAVDRTTYATLFGIISTTYGAGNGSTTFNLPDMRGRAVIGVGTGTKVATFASRASNVITVTGLSNASNNEFQTGQAVLYSAPSGAMTGLTHNTTYYLIRTGNLTFSLATSLANAQAGTVISLSSDGTGTQTFTKTLTARTLADTGGEENHAMSSSELLAHTHSNAFAGGNGYLNSPAGSYAQGTSGSTGGNAAMNIMQPFIVLNYIIKT